MLAHTGPRRAPQESDAAAHARVDPGPTQSAPPAEGSAHAEAPLRLNTDNPFGLCDSDVQEASSDGDDGADYWPEEIDTTAQPPPVADDADAEPPLVLSAVVPDQAAETATPAASPGLFGAQARTASAVRIPHIVVHASCERAEVADAVAAAALDPRLARAEFVIETGGLDSAIARLSRAASPDLLILDSTLPHADLLRKLEKLADVVFEETKVIVIGAVNDITLFRELTARGVSDYIVTPIAPEDFADALCALYADAGAASGGRVIALTGARGGVGASALARNIAWSIAERQDACAALIDLDLRFSAAASAPAQFTIADALQALETIDEEEIEHFGALRGRRLRVLGARSSLTRDIEIRTDAIATLIDHMRRTAPYIVLDLPHVWTPWTAEVLARADHAVIVAVRDLASLRNAKNMIEALKPRRGDDRMAPDVVVSMAGMPGRPEIPLKDMAEVLGAAPIASVPFDAYAFGAGDAEGLMVDECAPGSRAAHAIDALASRLTGRKIVRRVRGKAAPAVPLSIAPPVETSYPATPRRRREDVVHTAPQQAPQQRRADDPPPAPVAPARIEPAAPRVDAPAPQPSEPVAASAPALVREPPPRHTPSLNDAARYARALQQIEAGRARKAASLLRVVAENGLAPAQRRLAMLYAHGEGVNNDLARARHWAQRAAEAGCVDAMCDLGRYCLRGEGGAQDEAAALHWFQQAAAFGHRESQFELGMLYMRGRGVRANLDEALYWFLLAALQGDVAASGRAAEVAFQLTVARIEAVQARAALFSPATPDASANDVFVARNTARRRA